MLLKMFFAIIAAFFITLIGHYYLYVRLISPIFGNNFFWITTFICLWSTTFFGFLILRIVPHFFRKIFENIMFIWMGITFIFIIICLITSPINIYLNTTNQSTILLCYLVIILGTIVTIYSIYCALKEPDVVVTKIKIKKALPDNINSLKIVVLSDIHVSGLIDKKKMLKITHIVNSLSPDIIFLTGDLMDGSLKQLKNEIAPLKKLSAKNGIYYVTGNHEFYSGPQNWKHHFAEDFHWKVLSNSSHTLKIDNLIVNILGIEDRHWLNYEKMPKKTDHRLQHAVQHLEQNELFDKENSFNILLAHQPKDSKLLEKYRFIDLQISGHTHGGQLWPLQYIVKKDQKYVKGLYQINADQQIYVNQGTGFWGPPMRLGTKCEITLMTFELR